MRAEESCFVRLVCFEISDPRVLGIGWRNQEEEERAEKESDLSTVS